MANEIRWFELKNGAQIPSVGLGTYAVSPDTIYAAVKMGYRQIDCAHVYGNEKEIGYVLKKLFDEGIVERQDLFITSKLSNFDHAPEDVPEALNKTLSNLQLDHVNLYLIHWPVKLKKGSSGENPEDFLKPDIPSTWKAMEALYHAGKARAIGVSNFSEKKLSDLLEVALVPPAVNQVECHPLWQQAELHAFCKANGIHLSGYSPLGSQRANGVLVDPVVKIVAEKLGKTPGQVALRWGLQMGHSVLPKTSNEARLKENLDIFSWSIPEYLMANFSGIKQTKYIKAEELVHKESEGYKTIEELWDMEV